HTRFSRDWSSDVCSSDLDARSFSYFGADIQFTVQVIYPDLHIGQPNSIFRIILQLISPETLAIIFNSNKDHIIFDTALHQDVFGLGMFQGVIDQFLDDAVNMGLLLLAQDIKLAIQLQFDLSLGVLQTFT